MAYEFIWDLVDGGEVESSIAKRALVTRACIVKGIDTTVTTSKRALLDVINATPDIPALGEPFSDEFPTLRCVHKNGIGIPNTGGRMARIFAHYETPGGGGTPLERFGLEDSVASVAEPSQKIPKILEPMWCSLDTTAPVLTSDTQRPEVRLVTDTIQTSQRAIVLYGLFSDEPSETVIDAQNCVNDDVWLNRPKGHWKCEGIKKNFSSATGMWQVTAGFLSKGKAKGTDWSSYQFARSNAGEWVAPSTAFMTTLANQDYAFGRRNNTRGVYKYGGYELSPFGEIFGTSFPVGD